ncbi:UDP-N-acetylmuramoyl-L-alanyl-D-glutamate--2,6-diaminopimelate ligase [Alphaproteobacteria bacterium]|nr:UDP-N-acetylmuramoyl-L-alanyl-D-glutamate--2,6-diaminopimelate ligase [Alphaproteobacteria bacterium]
MNIQQLLKQSLNMGQNDLRPVSGIALDSRLVQKDNVFVAVPCATVDAHIAEALQKGAALIVQEKASQNSRTQKKIASAPAEKPRFVTVDNTRLAVARLCQAFYTPLPPKLLAVTGTNGKSSVVALAVQMLAALGIKAASMGTLGVRMHGNEQNALNTPPLTTYDAVSLHKLLQTLAQNNVACVALEATSHGLHQYRLSGLQFHAAGLTHVTQDHLDYHKTMEHYAKAKNILFSDLVLPTGGGVLNAQSSFFALFQKTCHDKGLKVLTYGPHSDAEWQFFEERPDHEGSQFSLRLGASFFPNLSFKLAGRFQIENLLCAMGLICSAYPDIKKEDLIATIPLLKPIPGRLEYVATHQGATIFVDFCHTPDALEKVLTELKARAKARVVVVFGCGGDRDATKRQPMGCIVARLADRVIVTEDNPRTEDPALIRAEILKGAPRAESVEGRERAIRQAVEDLHKDDILLIAGRGHETVQHIGGRDIPFNDRDVVQAILASFPK